MSEDYPGATDLATTMRGRWPWLSREQAWVLACIKIRPDRNENARHIGWDARRRPLMANALTPTRFKLRSGFENQTPG
jgi:hypothetical protein